MIDFVYGHDEEVAQFVIAVEGTQVAPTELGHCKTIGVIKDGSLIAGLVYFNYDSRSQVIELGMASTDPRWLNRVTYRRMFEYPFIECGCQMVIGRVRADAERTLTFAARMNFNLMYVPRMYGRDEDGVLCTLTDDQWLDSRVAKRVYRDVRKRREAA
jgi:hypothetical protein